MDHAEANLSRGLCFCQAGGDRQEPEARQTLDVALHVIRVADFAPHHLVAATDTHHHSAVSVGTLDGPGRTVATQIREVVERVLRAGQQDDVRLA